MRTALSVNGDLSLFVVVATELRLMLEENSEYSLANANNSFLQIVKKKICGS